MAVHSPDQLVIIVHRTLLLRASCYPRTDLVVQHVELMVRVLHGRRNCCLWPAGRSSGSSTRPLLCRHGGANA